MPFLTLSNADIQFAEKELTRRSYTTKEALPTTCWVDFINRKEFAKAALNENDKAFVIHIASFTSKMLIHQAQEAQIALLIAKKVTVLVEYSDFADVFSKESTQVLPARTRISKHTIEYEDRKQPSYRPI